MPVKGYVAVSLPTELHRRVKNIVETKKFGYRSITEFVADAVRKRMEEVERLNLEVEKHNLTSLFDNLTPIKTGEKR